MSWYVERLVARSIQQPTARAGYLAALLCVCVAATACSGSHDCGSEICDGKDNDCDGKVDEHFLDTEGRYSSVSHCGTCAIHCDEVHPTAAETICLIEDDEPTCRIKRCHPGERQAGDGACVSEVAVLCMACDSDAACDLRSEGARCLTGPDGSTHCGQRCDDPEQCPGGFVCQPQVDGGPSQCAPERGGCACNAAIEGAVLGCEIRLDDATA